MDKRILLIAPVFFGYEKAIISELKKRYSKVYFTSEVPFNSLLIFNAIRRIAPFLVSKVISKYHKSLINLVNKEKIDVVFVIRGSVLNSDFLEELRRRNIKLINYQWDSLQNNPNGLLISKYTSINISFDIADCTRYKEFSHVPLFYYWDHYVEQPYNLIKNDLVFVGGYHSNRHLVVRELMRQCLAQNIRFRPYIYIPWTVFLRKIFVGDKIKINEVKFRKLKRENYFHLLANSRAMLDIQSATQTGATMRTIETLSMRKKLISTNDMLRQEEFYHKNNICIWDCNSELDLRAIIDRPFDDSSYLKLLSLSGWLDRILAKLT